MRAYASELDLDPERTLAEFLAQFPAADGDSEASVGDKQQERANVLRMAAQAAVVLLPARRADSLGRPRHAIA